MRNVFALFMAAVFLGGGLSARAASPELCISKTPNALQRAEAECRQLADGERRLDATREALFLWTSADRATIRVGRTAGGNVDLASVAPFRVRLRLQGERNAWPAETTFVLTSGDHRWEWTADAEAARALREIVLPAGVYSLTAEARGHERRSIELRPERSSSVRDLGTIALEKTPVIHGVVTDAATRQPLAGVLIQLESGQTLAVTDADGAFRESLPAGGVPASITLSLGGYGARTIPLARTTNDVDLGTLELSAGGALRVRVRREGEAAVTVRVARKEGRKQTDVAKKELTAAAPEWTLAELTAGEYVVTVAGARPLQQAASAATVRAGETTDAEIEVVPIQLEGTVSRGEQRLRDAKLTIRALPHGWSGTVTTNERGEFAEELWQPGRFSVLISGESLPRPHALMEEVRATGIARWDVRIPSGSIAGRVLDAKTRQPIAGAEMTLDSELPHRGTRQSLGAESDQAGRFVFENVDAGQHVITAEAADYATARAPAITLKTPDERRTVELTLAKARKQSVIVTSPDGRPLAGAAVLHELLPPGLIPRTDAEGRVEIAYGGDVPLPLLIAAREGSFTVARVGERTDGPLRVIVPPATAAIALSVHDETTGAPLANAKLLMRYNGELLAPRLLDLAREALGSEFRTNADGLLMLSALPPGRYELWVYSTWQEGAALARGTTPPAATVLATSGMQNVRVVVRAASGVR